MTGVDRPHGQPATYARGCRCDLCREAAVERVRLWRARVAAQPIAEDMHGLRSTYVARGCRCDPCRAAMRALRQDRKQRRPPPAAHGKPSTYNNWGCRCEACSTAAADARRARRARARQ